MSNICDFCNKVFSNKYTLANHIKNTKTCINNRPQIKEIISENNFNCEYCNKQLASKQRLNHHLKKCVKFQIESSQKNLEKIVIEQRLTIEEKDKYITKLENQIQKLQDNISSIAEKAVKKPTTINNTTNDSRNITYNNLQPVNLNYDFLYQLLDKNLKIEHLYQGQIGLANVIADKLLTDENGDFIAFCNDKSRQIIKYKNDKGELIKDVKGFNLVNSIAPVAEEIAIKRKKEFEDIHYPKEEEKIEEKIEEKEEYDEEEIYDVEESSSEDEEIYDIDDEEFIRKINSLREEKNQEWRNEQVQKIIKDISEKEDWDEEKKEYYYKKLSEGIADLQILNVNSTLFSTQLSKKLPSDSKNK